MLKPAQLYKEDLAHKMMECWYDERYMYYTGWTDSPSLPDNSLPDNNEQHHHFVSVDKEDTIIGFMGYRIEWVTKSASNFVLISFDIGNIQLIKDVYQAIDDIFYKYNLNRLEFSCIEGNPVLKSYRQFIKKYGGVECGHYRDCSMLMNGKLADSYSFEVLKSEFKRRNRGLFTNKAEDKE